MEHELPRHEKIKFRRDEITDLASLPSAGTEPEAARQLASPTRPHDPASHRRRRGCAGPACPSRGLRDRRFGIGSERLRVAAEQALEQVAGVDIDAAVGPARITFDSMRFLALEVRDVSLKRTADGKAIAEAGAVRFGVRLLPLLSGDVRVSSASLSDARIMTDGLRSGESPDWTAALRNESGLIEPDLVAKAVFASAHKALNAMGSKSLRRIALDDVELVLPAGQGIASIRVVESELAEIERRQSRFFVGAGSRRPRTVELSASATRDDYDAPASPTSN